MWEQVTQVEFLSKAREPHPPDTISEGAMQVCRPVCARQRYPQPCEHHPHLPLLLTTIRRQLFTKGNSLFLIDPGISHGLKVTQHDCPNGF